MLLVCLKVNITGIQQSNHIIISKLLVCKIFDFKKSAIIIFELGMLVEKF